MDLQTGMIVRDMVDKRPLRSAYPTLPHARDWTDDTPDGVREAGMVLCVESYISRLGGHEGAKIEEQILVTSDGREQLSRFPAALQP